jgi:hypothetical protein
VVVVAVVAVAAAVVVCKPPLHSLYISTPLQVSPLVRG